MIPTLIDKQDTFEVIRDKIASILATESASQQALATAAAKDPKLWKLRVFTERSNPWEEWLNENTDQSPIVNVWYDSSNFDPSGSDVMERQKTDATFNIDCYGYGVSTSETVGHTPGDKDAAFNLHRAIRLVRNILMAAEYTYLGQRGLVWHRWPQSITSFQPQLGSNPVQQIVGARISFVVTFNEFSPQFSLSVLELVTTDIKRSETGEILVEADYDYTTP